MLDDTHPRSEPPAPESANGSAEDGGFAPLHPERLTWAVLLVRWVSFARSALALTETGEAGRMRQAVPEIIGLQAVWFALGQIDELEGQERALGLDRARVLIDRHTAAVHRLWSGKALPVELEELIADADRAWADASE